MNIHAKYAEAMQPEDASKYLGFIDASARLEDEGEMEDAINYAAAAAGILSRYRSVVKAIDLIELTSNR